MRDSGLLDQSDSMKAAIGQKLDVQYEFSASVAWAFVTPSFSISRVPQRRYADRNLCYGRNASYCASRPDTDRS